MTRSAATLLVVLLAAFRAEASLAPAFSHFFSKSSSPSALRGKAVPTLELRGGALKTEELKTKLKLSIECKGLEYSDWKTWPFSKADPMVLLQLRAPDGTYTEVGRTEVVSDSPSPVFASKIEIDYFFETKQHLRLVVVQGSDPKLPELGRMDCTLSAIVGSRGSKLEGDLHSKRKGGKVMVMAEEVKGKAGDMLDVTFRGVTLAAKDGFLLKSDPYLSLFRRRPDRSLVHVHRTETITQNLNPVWKPIKVPLSELCNGDLSAPFRIECWDEDTLSKDDEIGSVNCTASEILNRVELPLIDSQGRESLKCGTLKVDRACVRRIPTLVDYLGSGCQITVTVAVDFTASNQDQHLPTSFHYNGGKGLNQYQEAMSAVGEVLIEYDHDKKIAAFGYGAILPGESGPSHCFPLSLNHNTPDVSGVQGLLDAYKGCLSRVTLHGPTNFAPTIERAALLAEETSKQHYQVLLIVTDGCITDKSATVDALVKASHLPLSVIIVGVGDEDFSDMSFLDADTEPLVDGDGNKAVRDIVQFVPFREFKGHGSLLAAQVLRELPSQLLQYQALNANKPPSWKEDMPWLELPEDSAWAFRAT
eukprot:CAMPEP_0202809022 /NCGR_PEP_ID=MMETSP1389-20130828/1441_1 /ASSEMBLY_ACC=CAM_ASM_000865 /TAXON_ID=302021 /ORGANISM="Rhodomonas sp., Strain CCMP768" /LENGTH=589 /DNA_ID=CAMNT_0049479523 /DNA_START=15 /DNA_END=1784 /DNA_ORIENTATION=-